LSVNRKVHGIVCVWLSTFFFKRSTEKKTKVYNLIGKIIYDMENECNTGDNITFACLKYCCDMFSSKLFAFLELAESFVSRAAAWARTDIAQHD